MSRFLRSHILLYLAPGLTPSAPRTFQHSSQPTFKTAELPSRPIQTLLQTMDAKMDVDVGKIPEPHRLSPTSDPGSIPTLDGWIENLMNCKQLAENDVQRLCDRVSTVNAGSSGLCPGCDTDCSPTGSRGASRGVECPASGMVFLHVNLRFHLLIHHP